MMGLDDDKLIEKIFDETREKNKNLIVNLYEYDRYDIPALRELLQFESRPHAEEAVWHVIKNRLKKSSHDTNKSLFDEFDADFLVEISKKYPDIFDYDFIVSLLKEKNYKALSFFFEALARENPAILAKSPKGSKTSTLMTALRYDLDTFKKALKILIEDQLEQFVELFELDVLEDNQYSLSLLEFCYSTKSEMLPALIAKVAEKYPDKIEDMLNRTVHHFEDSPAFFISILAASNTEQYARLFETLVCFGADEYMQNAKGDPFLHFAYKYAKEAFSTESAEVHLIKSLLQVGADPLAKDSHGKSFYKLVVEEYQEELEKLCLEKIHSVYDRRVESASALQSPPQKKPALRIRRLHRL